MFVRIVLVVIFVVLAQRGSPFAQAGPPTIPELVQRVGPNPVHQIRRVELVPDTMEELVLKSTVVLIGQVRRQNTYLSDNQRELYTDYVIAPTGTAATAAKTPTTITKGEVVVRQWGGEMTIANVPVIFETTEFRAFHNGDTLLLFLQPDEQPNKFKIVGGGVFELDGDRITPMVAHERHEAFRGATLNQFLAEVAIANKNALR
jgi:hypothetical protein